MPRCLVYCSVAFRPWSAREVEELVVRSDARNAAEQVSARTVYSQEGFVQVLEGPAAAVDRVFRRIAADPRHHSLTLLLDRIMPAADAASAGLGAIGGFSPESDVFPDHVPLLELMASQAGRVVGGSLRTPPRQTRAIETVDRLLMSAERMMVRLGLSKVNLRDVALDADVALQTAYRCFQHSEDLLRSIVTRRQTLVLRRARAALSQENLFSEQDLARAVARFLAASYQRRAVMPQAVWQFLLRTHHELQYDELWSLAEAALGTLRRCGVPTASIDQLAVATGLAAAAAAGKGIALRDPALLRGQFYQAMLEEVFLAALRVRRP